MWLFGRKKDPDAYEKELVQIAEKISKRQHQQLKYSIRGRRATLFVTLYSIIIYATYSGLIFFGIRPKSSVNIATLVGAPLVIWLIRTAIARWFGWLSSSNDEQLRALLTRQREIIEELKQQTNYYSTQALIQRFDPSQYSNQEKSKPKKAGRKPRQTPSSDQGPSHGTTPGPNQGPTPGPNQSATGPSGVIQNADARLGLNGKFNPQLPNLGPQSQDKPLPQVQLPLTPGVTQSGRLLKATQIPYEPKWYDRILDLIVGEDEYSPRLRYALICKKCHAHNGLAQPGELPQDVLYFCPHCHELNGDPKPEADNSEKSDEDKPEEPGVDKAKGESGNDSPNKDEDNDGGGPSTKHKQDLDGSESSIAEELGSHDSKSTGLDDKSPRKRTKVWQQDDTDEQDKD